MLYLNHSQYNGISFYSIPKRFILLLIVITAYFFSCNRVSAQTDLEHKAPTLQIGLDGLGLSKGTLDYKIIMEMVAEKQSEIKLKFIQNLFLRKIENAGGLTYSYVDNVLKAIIFEKDPNIRAKIVLEHTVNIVFVAAFVDYYLRMAGDGNHDSIKAELDCMASYYGCTIDYSTHSPIKSIRSNSSMNDYNFAETSGASSMIAMLLDLGSEAIRKDQHLKRLGLMQVSHSIGYEYKNEYLKLIRLAGIEAPSESDVSFEKSATSVYSSMFGALTQITNVIGLVNFVVSENTFRNAELNMITKTSPLTTVTDNVSLIKILNQENTNLLSVIYNLPTSWPSNDSLQKKEIQNLVQVKNYLLKAEQFLSEFDDCKTIDNASVLSDILYSLNSDFIPALEAIAYKDPSVLSTTLALKDFNRGVAEKLIDVLDISELENQRVKPFILLTSKLYQFDRARTFADYLSYVNDLVDLFPDDRIKTVFSSVNTFVKDYTVIRLNEKGKEVLEFNIESFLVKLKTIKKEKYNPFEFHFTVGVNTGYFRDPVTFHDETISSFSTISEKLGFKFKLWDYRFKRFREPGETYNGFFGRTWVRDAAPQDPLVSNLHLVFYGSGLLYSILNTSTNKTFDAPIVGTGLGVTFSNALDMNVGLAVPVFGDRSFNNSRKNPLITLGFDLQLSEYLGRLARKNK